MMPRHAIVLFGYLGLVVAGGACVGQASSTEGPASGRGGNTAGSGGQAGGAGGRGGSGGQTGGGGGRNQGGAAGVAADAGPGADAPGPDLAPPDGPPPAPAWARGVSITLVEMAQAAFSKLGDGQSAVDLDDRTAVVVEERDVVVRVHFRTAADFQARQLEAILTVSAGGTGGPGDGSADAGMGDAGAAAVSGDAGTQAAGLTRLQDRRQIAGPSRVEDLTSTFNFRIPAALVKPKSALSVEIFEIEPASSAAVAPEPLPRFPRTGTADLGVKPGLMVLDVALVPARGPSGPLDDSPARRKRLENHLFDVYPVQKLNVRWLPPVTVPRDLSIDAAFALLRDLRERENAQPYEYFHLLVANEDTEDNLLGIANGAGAGINQGPRRIAMSFVRQHRVDSVLDTTSHEIGHNHGRAHAPNCNAQGTDDDYPYPNGALGVAGYSLSDNELFTTTRRFDLMGYCSPTWISDYTWNAFEARVRAVSRFPRAAAGAPAPLLGFSLQGFWGAGKAEPRWGLVRGDLATEDAGELDSEEGTALLILADGRQRRVPATLQRLSDGKTREIAVSLGGPASIVQAEVEIGGRIFSVPASAFTGTWPVIQGR